MATSPAARKGEVREHDEQTTRRAEAPGKTAPAEMVAPSRESAVAGQAAAHREHGGLHVQMVRVPVITMPRATAGRVLWWGGLTAVAAFGVVDWPVVALVAAGSWVAEQYARDAARHEDAGREPSD